MSLSTLSLHLSVFEATSLAGPLAFDLISSPGLLPPLSLAFTHLAHASMLLALYNPSTRLPPAVPLALRTLVAVLGILLALSSDERWSVALVDADLLPTLVRVAVLGRRAAEEGPSADSATTAVPPASASAKSESEAPPSSDGTSSLATGDSEPGAAPVSAMTEEAKLRLVWDALSLSVGVLANVLDAADAQAGDTLLELGEFLHAASEGWEIRDADLITRSQN